jgi:poly-gamma-glutamate synthesis protein (capsule biosynthesis protein)
VLAVSFHKGIAHTPAKLAEYEHQVSYAAIDAGADVIFGHHAHILKGIEVYKGRTIFHGLCNFVAYVPLLAPKPNQDALSWARRRRELFGFDPDPEYPTYPFHPDAKYTIMGKCTVEDKRIVQTSYVPCLVDKQAAPHVLGNDVQGQAVFDYMDRITRAANLNAHYEWQGDEVVIKSEA